MESVLESHVTCASRWNSRSSESDLRNDRVTRRERNANRYSGWLAGASQSLPYLGAGASLNRAAVLTRERPQRESVSRSRERERERERETPFCFSLLSRAGLVPRSPRATDVETRRSRETQHNVGRETRASRVWGEARSSRRWRSDSRAQNSREGRGVLRGEK